jgi:hypothetical protein
VSPRRSPCNVGLVNRSSTAWLLALFAGTACASHATSGSGDFGPAPTDAGAVTTEAGPDDEAPAPAADDASMTFAQAEGGTSGCRPGTYTGQYSGTYQSLVPTTGPVTITLTAYTKPSGEFELVTNDGTWDTGWGPTAGDASLIVEQGHATLEGQLDCTDDVFTAAGTNSYFTILGIEAGTFSLTLDGTYDPATATITGNFTYMSNAGNGGGTWQVTLAD